MRRALGIVLGILLAAVCLWLFFRGVDAAALWRRVLPWTNRRGKPARGIGGAIGLGLAWGWLPCGMTYSMLLLSATTASAAWGAAVMLAFGLGTLPSMVTATVAFERIARALSSRATLRNVAGALLLAFGLYTAGNALMHVRPAPQQQQQGHEHMHH